MANSVRKAGNVRPRSRFASIGCNE
jgi:hypothetical protein